MKYAIIRINGNQHRVSEGEELLVDKVRKDLRVEVLLVADGEKVQVGKPDLQSQKVKFKIFDEEVKGQKVDVFKFKAKARYRKKIGFRPRLTKIKIEKITS